MHVSTATARTLRPLVPLALMTLSACTPPAIASLDQSSGPEHALVLVQGTNVILSSIIWDAGLPSETTIPGGFLGGYMFSVPPGASLGNHPVALQNSRGRSATMNFTVTAPQPFGVPRIDHVIVGGATFDGAGNVTAYLYVSGANLDVGSVLRVDGADVATVAHRGLRNDLLAVAPTALAYPIYHYVSIFGVPGARPAGSTLALTVRNLDGQVSQVVNFRLPASAATLDSDGDSLLDSWETNGYDANGDGTIDIDLKALGARPFRRDILLEVDVMQGLTNPPIASAPGAPGTFDSVKAMFAAAPVLNPDTDAGINLILDTSGSVPYWTLVGFDAVDNAMLGTARYATLKAANFDNANRDNIYHYAIWASAMPGGFSGISDIQFDMAGNVTGPGDDFIVSFDTFPAAYQTLKSQVATLAHEFGHNLSQQHGGNNNSRYKPNYWSVMSYSWQLRTGITNAARRQRVTCLPFYYAAAGTTEPNGALPMMFSGAADYSEGMAAALVENTNTLSETTGVCGAAVDWNDDGDQADVMLNADVDDNGVANETVTDFANWRALVFNGPASDGSVVP